MPRNRTISNFCGPFTDQRLRCDVRPGLAPRTLPWRTQRASGAKTPVQFALERAAAFNVERLIDRLMADTHRLIIREVELDPVRDLLRTPGLHPRSVLAVRLVITGPPRWLRPCHDRTIGSADLAREPLLDIGMQPLIGDQLGSLRALGRQLGLPLRNRRAVLGCVSASGNVAAQLTRDSGGISTNSPSDLAHPSALDPQQRDLLALTNDR